MEGGDRKENLSAVESFKKQALERELLKEMQKVEKKS